MEQFGAMRGPRKLMFLLIFFQRRTEEEKNTQINKTFLEILLWRVFYEEHEKTRNEKLDYVSDSCYRRCFEDDNLTTSSYEMNEFSFSS